MATEYYRHSKNNNYKENTTDNNAVCFINCSFLLYREIPAAVGQVLQVRMDVDGCHNTYNEVRFLEHVQCKISLRYFPRGNLRILLTSPMGTTSTLLFERPRDVVSSNFDDWPFLSVHYWGEKADGRWTLQIVNGGNRHVNQPGEFPPGESTT